MPERAARAVLALALTVNAAGAWADEVSDGIPAGRPHLDIEPDRSASAPEVLLGAGLLSAADYQGSDRRSLKLRPLLGLRWGRLRLTSSGSGGLMDLGNQREESGASAELLDSDRWSLRTGVRLGGGRSASASPELAGLADVRRTALGRISAGYRLTPQWRISSTLSVDLLGRGNGGTVALGIDHRRALGPATVFTAGAGINWANSTHMQHFFGVPEAAARADRSPYHPGAGWRDIGLGLGLSTRLSAQWVAFGSLGYTRLIGQAADSPLAHRTASPSAQIGLAWHCCRP